MTRSLIRLRINLDEIFAHLNYYFHFNYVPLPITINKDGKAAQALAQEYKSKEVLELVSYYLWPAYCFV